MKPSVRVRLLRIIFSPNLTLMKYVPTVSADCFYHLRQIRYVCRCLDDESAARFEHSCMPSLPCSRTDCCISLLAGSKTSCSESLTPLLACYQNLNVWPWSVLPEETYAARARCGRQDPISSCSDCLSIPSQPDTNLTRLSKFHTLQSSLYHAVELSSSFLLLS